MKRNFNRDILLMFKLLFLDETCIDLYRTRNIYEAFDVLSSIYTTSLNMPFKV